MANFSDDLVGESSLVAFCQPCVLGKPLQMLHVIPPMSELQHNLELEL